jgi:hypothetical protein
MQIALSTEMSHPGHLRASYEVTARTREEEAVTMTRSTAAIGTTGRPLNDRLSTEDATGLPAQDVS